MTRAVHQIDIRKEQFTTAFAQLWTAHLDRLILGWGRTMHRWRRQGADCRATRAALFAPSPSGRGIC